MIGVNSQLIKPYLATTTLLKAILSIILRTIFLRNKLKKRFHSVKEQFYEQSLP